ncbi:MAG TPA: type II toxin-antitoxin system VapC family toxin [Gemmatimonadaceae bacterium]|nr:type II toxin-antitoxin system VapC family toxin [Gemmatimonadaceae bacterium]
MIAQASVPGPSARLLLDTHVWLWWQADDRRLSKTARAAIMGAAEVYVSAASAWEMAIKTALGKLDAPDDVAGAVDAGGFSELPVHFRHIAALCILPAHHRDPFDRLLLAQAYVDDLTFVTADPTLPQYGIPYLWAGR